MVIMMKFLFFCFVLVYLNVIPMYSFQDCYLDILDAKKKMTSSLTTQEPSKGVRLQCKLNSDVLNRDNNVVKVSEDLSITMAGKTFAIKSKEADIITHGTTFILIVHSRKLILINSQKLEDKFQGSSLLNLVTSFTNEDISKMKHSPCYDTTIANSKSVAMDFYPYSLPLYKGSLITKLTYYFDKSQNSISACKFTFDATHNVKYSILQFGASDIVDVGDEYTDIGKFIFTSTGKLLSQYKGYKCIDNTNQKGSR
jgi:hypothetical protein